MDRRPIGLLLLYAGSIPALSSFGHAMKTFTFGIRKTPKCSVAWVVSPSGRKQEALFRNGYAGADISAQKWIDNQIAVIREGTEIDGGPEYAIVQTHKQRDKTATLPDRITFRPGSLSGPLSSRLAETDETPSEYLRRIIAADLGRKPPKMDGHVQTINRVNERARKKK